MSEFVERRRYMTVLGDELEKVRETGEGRLVSMRGRRRVGKSRLDAGTAAGRQVAPGGGVYPA